MIGPSRAGACNDAGASDLIVSAGMSIAQRAGAMRGQFQAQGIVRSAPDMLIAATAIEHQLVLATRNVRDFMGCGVQVVNPFDD